MTQEIVWERRFSDFKNALERLDGAVGYVRANFYKDGEYGKKPEGQVRDLVMDGLVHRFEHVHELAWNVMKEFLEGKEGVMIIGPKDATGEAYSAGLIDRGKTWLEMVRTRGQTSRTYNEEDAREIFKVIVEEYYSEFIAFRESMEKMLENTRSI